MGRGRRKIPYRDEVYMAALAYLRLVKREDAKDAARLVGVGEDKARYYLRRAHELGYVEPPTLNFPLTVDEQLTVDLVKTFGNQIERFVIMPSWPERSWRRGHQLTERSAVERFRYENFLWQNVGRLAARFVEDEVKLADGDRVALGEGRGMLAFAERFRAKEKLLLLRPLVYSTRWRVGGYADALSVAQTIIHRHADEFAARPQSIRLEGTSIPYLPGNIEPAINCKLALCEIGEIGDMPKFKGQDAINPNNYLELVADRLMRERLSDLPEERYMEGLAGPTPTDYKAAMRKVKEGNAVGEICRNAIDPDGEEVPGLVDEVDEIERSAMSLSSIEMWRDYGDAQTIVLGVGRDRAPALRAAIRGRYFTTAIIDHALAEELLRLDETEKLDRSKPRKMKHR